ncbi:hypothetical protein [Marinicellulosiphila megalodicopiae]|uniref:hypothetical protein n=1 Tax=Marinicellulosiphila megalodicopiae TaxID=2724896 RepID=UPI003BAFC7BA
MKQFIISVICANFLILSSCMWAPLNGAVLSGNSQTIPINISGAYSKPNMPITIEGYNMANASWEVIGQATTNSTANLDNDKGQLYFFNQTVTAGNLWEQDGIMQVRAYSIDGGRKFYLVTFDDFGCLVDRLNAGDTYSDAGIACASYNTSIVTLNDSGNTPDYDISVNPFLSVRTPSGNIDYDCSDNICEQKEYYAATNTPSTFTGWYLDSTFSEPFLIVNKPIVQSFSPLVQFLSASAQYYNAFDLGFGRNMNCKKSFNTGRVSCYVKNHGQVVIDDHVTAIADAISGNNLVATVVMNYEPTSNNNAVTFAAYNSAGTLLNDVQLDNQGVKPMPGLCLNCHGGNYNAATNSITGANFLPFDLDNFLYSDVDVTKSQAAQEESFRKLNQIISLTNVPTDMAGIINGWYDNNLQTANQTFNGEYYPNDWVNYKVVYDEVVKPYCRTCHVAMEPYRDWDSASELAGYSSYALDLVCNDNAISRMPHAELTMDKFWKSSGRAHLIAFMQKEAGYQVTESCAP